jgi:hypothetical protein
MISLQSLKAKKCYFVVAQICIEKLDKDKVATNWGLSFIVAASVSFS